MTDERDDEDAAEVQANHSNDPIVFFENNKRKNEKTKKKTKHFLQKF